MVEENDVIDMGLYTNEGWDFLSIIKNKFIDHNFKERSKFPNRVIKTELRPDDNIVKSFYVELFAAYYSGLFNAALSVGMELLEYMTRCIYSEIKQIDYCTKDWRPVIIKGLKDMFISDVRKTILLENIDIIAKKYRNPQSHGNLHQLLEDYRVNDINLRTGEIKQRQKIFISPRKFHVDVFLG